MGEEFFLSKLVEVDTYLRGAFIILFAPLIATDEKLLNRFI